MEFLQNSLESLNITTTSQSKPWVDITSLCRQASLQLSDQIPLICTEGFSLFESMSAVELMDPKMDQCCGLVGSIEIKDLVNFQQKELLLSFDIISEILQSVVICEVQFLNGASLLESLHQCKFSWPESWKNLELSDNLPTRSLLYFSKSTHKCLWKVMRSVLEAGIYEEEDFQPQSRYNPINDIDDNDAVIHQNINEIIGLIQESMTSNHIESETGKLMHGLLSFRNKTHHFYELIEVFINDCLRTHSDHSIVTNDIDQYLLRLVPILVLVNEIIDLLVSLESKNFKNVTPHTGNDSVAFAFDSSMSRSMQTTPLRHIPFTDFSTSISYLKSMFIELREECVHLQILLQNPSNTLNYEHLLQLCICISQNHKHLLVRSFVWSTLHLLSPKITQSILVSMKSRGLPSCILGNETTLKWTTMIERTAWDTLSCFLSNRHRLLSRLDNLFRYWGAIVRDAGMIDSKLMEILEIDANNEKQQWMSTWVLILVSSLYDAHMGVVVESQLLGKNELDYFYWYWDYILSSRVYATRRLSDLKMSLAIKKYESNRIEATETMKALKRTKKDKDKDSTKKWSKAECQRILDEPPPAPTFQTIEDFITKAKGSLVKGLFRVYVALSSFGLTQKPENPYTSWEFRFFNRFRAFQNIANPPLLDLEAFQQVADSSKEVSLTDICNASLHCFKTAKAILDEARKLEAVSKSDNNVYDQLLYAQVMQLSKVCVASSVSTIKLLKALSDIKIPINTSTTTTNTTSSVSTDLTADNLEPKSVSTVNDSESSMARILLGEKEQKEAYLVPLKKLKLSIDNSLHPYFFRPELKTLE